MRRGDPAEEKPGERIVIPEHPAQIRVKDVDLDQLRKSYVKNCLNYYKGVKITPEDIKFLAEDTKTSENYIENLIREIQP